MATTAGTSLAQRLGAIGDVSALRVEPRFQLVRRRHIRIGMKQRGEARIQLLAWARDIVNEESNMMRATCLDSTRQLGNSSPTQCTWRPAQQCCCYSRVQPFVPTASAQSATTESCRTTGSKAHTVTMLWSKRTSVFLISGLPALEVIERSGVCRTTTPTMSTSAFNGMSWAE